jgi:hypothetical protein
MPAVKPEAAAPDTTSWPATLHDWEFETCLGRSKFAEVWRARGPQGELCAVKLIHGLARVFDPRSPRLLAAAKLAQVRHPHLLEVTHVKHDRGCVILITALAERTLRDRLEECQASGAPGIPRDELLDYLRQAAAGLDFLREQRQLRHLGLSPRNLLLNGYQLLVTDYGVVEQLWAPEGMPYAQYNPRYAPPELFRDQPHDASDQYSLALIYQEMLTGRLPQRDVAMRKCIRTRSQLESDLSDLPGVDQIVVARALDGDPDRRFASCSEFIDLLRRHDAAVVRLNRPRPKVVPVQGPPAAQGESLTRQVQSMVQNARGEIETRSFSRGRYQMSAEGIMRHRCAAWLPPGIAWRKLEALLNGWGAQVLRCAEEQIVFQLQRAPNFWQRLFAASGALIEVRLQLVRGDCKLTQVLIEVESVGQSGKAARRVVEAVGPQLLDQVSAHLLATPERRVQDRFAFHESLRLAEDRRGLAISLHDAIAKDISLTGIGFYSKQPPPGSVLYIQRVGGADQDHPPIPAAVTRVQRTADGWYEAGARIIYELDPNQSKGDVVVEPPPEPPAEGP